ncbi:phospholipase D family protein [Roseivivax sp. CAU 1761]
MTFRALITAAEVYPRLEALAFGAERELFLSYRVFEPDTKLRNPEIRAQGLDTWLDLLCAVARRGVRIRLAITDFDPLFAADLHRLSWHSARRFAEAVEGDVQVVVAPHGQEVGWIWRRALVFQVLAKLRELKAEVEDKLTPVQREMLKNRPYLRPVSLHQKIAVADGRHTVIGGLDVNERRWDDNEHDRPAEETWHDVSLEIEGAFAGVVRRHAIDTWNRAHDQGGHALTERAEPIALEEGPQDVGRLRLLRTISEPRRGALRFGPDCLVREHEEAHLALFAEARDHIYIESQFLRHRDLSRALCQAAAREPDLQLIVLLPPEPERILFGGADTWDARHAHALQTIALNDIRRAFGDRLALISPGQKRPASPGFSRALGGAGPIYVHSKVTLVDDRVGIVGSANLNGRSLRWDIEAGVQFHDPEQVRALRLRLAEKWLAGHLPGRDPSRAATWTEAARANAERPPEERDGFAMPYPLGRGRRFSRYLPVLPAEMF